MTQTQRYNLILLFGVLIVLGLSGIHQVLDYPPMSIHAWRQADCLSLSKNYSENLNFFEPSIHNYISDEGKSGKTAGEFPILYYFVGFIWSIFGESIFFYRALGLFVYLIGIFYLKKALFKLSQSHFWSVAVTLLFFCSPVLLYYSISFLPNVYALSLVFIAWYHSLSYLRKESGNHMVSLFIFFLLAGLLKITALISLIALCVGLCADALLKKRFPKPYFKLVGASLLVFMIVAGYYRWVDYYNGIHGGEYTYNSIWPIWDMETERLRKAIEVGKELIYVQLLNRTSWSVLWITFLLLLLNWRKKPALLIGLVALFFGAILYYMLWFNAFFESHDYYSVNLMIFPISVMGVALYFLRDNPYLKIKPVKTGAVIFVLYNVLFVATNLRVRFQDQLFNDRVTQRFFMSAYEMRFWEGMEYMTNKSSHLMNMREYNRSIGIEPNDLIVYIGDPSFNVSLYLLDQKGWTSFYLNGTKTSEGIQDKIDLGAKYLFIYRKHEMDHAFLLPFLNHKLGEFEGTEVYYID